MQKQQASGKPQVKPVSTHFFLFSRKILTRKGTSLNLYAHTFLWGQT